VIDTLIQQYQGRVVGSAGDSVLAEFVSVVDAVQCAVEIQHALRAKNTELPEHRRMEFRIGINLGDVMVEGEQIYGDGVNIAARLEALADGGSICVSGVVHDQVKNKLTLTYEDLGEQQVKNIAEPVRVWRIQAEKSDSPRSQVPSPKLRRAGIDRHSRTVLVAVGLLIVGAVATLLYPSWQTLRIPQSEIRNQEALPLPDKPSIAVLPFVNMSEDPKQEYFSDGITEDLITDLSKLSGLFVISRNSAFIYKGKAVKAVDVSKEFGVRYVLEGSVRKAESQVRVTAQLVDATTDHHIWAERYDRPLQDIFALQDEIVRKIVTTLKLQLTLQEQGILVRKTTDNLEAYDYFLRGTEYSWQFTKEANAQARHMFERAVELDPQYALAYANIGLTYFREWTSQWNTDPQILARATELAQKAVALDDSVPGAHGILSQIYLNKMQHDQAIAEAERAIALDPNRADGYADLAFILRWSGRAEEAVEIMKKAMRLNPRYPPFYQNRLGFIYCQVGQYEEAITAQKGALSRNPNLLPSHICLAACYSMAGRDEEARAQVKEILRLSSNYSLEVTARQLAPWKNPADGKAMLDALRKAGLK
ncbi:MAG TPA: adenylate/guanylate cyclase domain-containing protein, partial [Candidatus Binatia bacterium]|nr:adenylate/guanylate cyclase domain-containing protein [Candidatus Binatia bacterium]